MKDLDSNWRAIQDLLRVVGNGQPTRQTHGVLTLSAVLFIILGACTSSPTPPTASVPTPSRTAVRLGPTSTFPPSETPSPSSPPTATLVPLQPVSDEDWSRGPREAAVTLVVYSDFQ